LKDALEVVEVDLRGKSRNYLKWSLFSYPNYIDDDYQVKMALKEISGRETFPNIFLNGQTLGGSDDLEELHKTGQLTALLDENQLLV
jgi:glutaredoxin